MFVWNQNVCQTAASSHLSVGGWRVRLPSVAPLMCHGGCVWSMLGGGWVGRVRCQCESALFPALDAWSVSLVTADLPVFTLSLHSSSSSSLQCADLCDHAWLCGTCGLFFFRETNHSTHAARTAFLSLYIGLGGALHLNLTAALGRVLCRELSLSIWRCDISRKTAAQCVPSCLSWCD